MLAQESRSVYASGECEVDLARRELRVLGASTPIGGRAFDILELLVRSAGELVSKDELMEHVWPGVIVLDNTLQVHIAAMRRALGPYRALLRTESGRGYRLLGDWAARGVETGDASARNPPPQLSDEARTSNLPAAITSLIGRAATARSLRDLISAYRIVTLTGPGGIGKTVLAIEAARGVLSDYQGGGWLVELASLTDAGLVPSAAAGVLGLKLAGGAISAEAVARAIGVPIFSWSSTTASTSSMPRPNWPKRSCGFARTPRCWRQAARCCASTAKRSIAFRRSMFRKPGRRIRNKFYAAAGSSFSSRGQESSVSISRPTLNTCR
jgi:DNA-binding winged helix-turn-helix (wHTH) protein